MPPCQTKSFRSGCGVADLGTPRSVLPGVSCDWSDSSADIQFEPGAKYIQKGVARPPPWPKGVALSHSQMEEDFFLVFFFLKKKIYFLIF
jgi:hypothetical protein